VPWQELAGSSVPLFSAHLLLIAHKPLLLAHIKQFGFATPPITTKDTKVSLQKKKKMAEDFCTPSLQHP
jgi:hypothetical protein